MATPEVVNNSSHYHDSGYGPGSTPLLPRGEDRCGLFPTNLAIWLYLPTTTPLSTLSATVLIYEDLINRTDLEIYPTTSRSHEQGPSDPISGVFAAAYSAVGGILMGVADYPLEITKMVKEDRPIAKSMAVDFALDSGKGVSRIIGTGLRMPMDFTLGLSRGFHNLPKTYGDDTVRKERVVDMKSGLIVGGKVS